MASNAQSSWGCCACEDMEEDDRYIACTRCGRRYHFLCLSIPETSGDSVDYSNWKCPDCVSRLPKTTKKDSTPIRSAPTTARSNKRPALNSPPTDRPSVVTAEDVRSIVRDVIKEEFTTMLEKLNSTIIRNINRELAPIKEDVQELKSSLNFHTKEFEELQLEHIVSKNQIKTLSNENEQLKNTVLDLNLRLNNLEQHARSNNLELQCLPENKGENLYTAVKKLGSVVGCVLKDSDIYHITRIAKLNTSSNRPRSVVIQLASPKIRDQLLAATITYNKHHSNNKLNSAHFGLAGKNTPVYVVEHLSPANKALHAATRLKAKEKGYKYVWVRSGRVFVRKNDDSDHIQIRNQDCLKKIL